MKTSTPLVSVIIPIYNVEKYLKECLDSVINQTYKNLEIILVDDKTPDNSGKIADQYAKKDKRIKVIHKSKNEGLNMARATGFLKSCGSFITFVDSDDMIKESFVSDSVELITKYGADFVRSNLSEFNDHSELKNKPISKIAHQELVIKGKRDLYMTQICGMPNGFSIAMCVCGALYSRRVIQPINWEDCNFRAFEDNIWTLRLLESVDAAVYINKGGYLYRKNVKSDETLSQSMLGNSRNEHPVGYLEFLDILVRDFLRYNEIYQLRLEKEIAYFAGTYFPSRIKKLADNRLLNKENNLEYIPEALTYIQDFREMLIAENELLKKENSLLKSDTPIQGVKKSGVLFAKSLRRKLYSYFR